MTFLCTHKTDNPPFICIQIRDGHKIPNECEKTIYDDRLQSNKSATKLKLIK